MMLYTVHHIYHAWMIAKHLKPNVLLYFYIYIVSDHIPLWTVIVERILIPQAKVIRPPIELKLLLQ